MVYHESKEINGKALTFTRYGEWTDICCLFFHGFLASSDFLPPDADKEGLCVLSFDRPGVGMSDLIGEYEMEDFFSLIKDVLKEHGVSGLHLFGHSAGGFYAQVFAEQNKEITRSLTLLSSLPPLNCSETEHLMTRDLLKRRFFITKCRPIARLYFLTTAYVVNKKIDKILDDRIDLMASFEQSIYKANKEIYKDAILMSVTKRAKGAYLDAISLFAKREHPHIDPLIPVYVWNGDKDETTTVGFAQYLAKTYNAKEIHIVPGGTHMMFFSVWHDAAAEALGTRE